MTPFDGYAEFYDLMYVEKDYVGEVDYVESMWASTMPRPTTVLDLGCGSGAHAAELARRGYSVCGVDRSQRMLDLAADRLRRLPEPVAARLTLVAGDVRKVRLHRTFDVVVSLFHVASYQAADADLEEFFATAASHLAPGGCLFFDFWYGPAVLSCLPEVRVRRFSSGPRDIIRIAEPTLRADEDCVDIDYTLLVRDGQGGPDHEIRERHTMRYLFLPELRSLLARTGLRAGAAHEWLAHRAPSLSTWSACLSAAR